MIRDDIAKANGIFYASTDVSELGEATKLLVKLMQNPVIDEGNRMDCDALLIKISLKRASILYFLEGYCDDDYKKLTEYADYARTYSQEQGYNKSGELAEKVKSAADFVNAIMFDAAHLRDTIRNDRDECIASTVEECDAVVKAFAEKIDKAKEADFDPLFGEGVKFPSVKETMLKDLNDEYDFARVNYEKMKNADVERLFREVSSQPDAVISSYNYNPKCLVDSTKANTLTLCTPLPAEAEFFAISNCKARDRELCVINAASLSSCSATRVEKLFALIASKGKDVLIKGLSRYERDNKDTVLKEAVKLGKKGVKVFIIDTDAKKSLYNKMLELANGEEGLSSLDVSFMFISLPESSLLKEEMFKRGMLGEDYTLFAEIKDSIVFAGFVGVNKAFNAFVTGRDWQSVLNAESDLNRTAALAFLRDLPSQFPLLDSGWGNFEEFIDRSKVKSKKDFNYDELRGINPENIRTILEGDFTLYQKCGMVAKYSVLHGNDINVWAPLPDEEKTERLTDAVNLLYFLLELENVPEVKYEKLPEGIAGLCCDGGKVIKFSNKHCNDPGFVIEVICHECHHSLQHEAVDGPWKEWYWTELGITKGRLDGWRENMKSGMYLDIKDGLNAYRVQVIECEARAFAIDCVSHADEVWSKVKFI